MQYTVYYCTDGTDYYIGRSFDSPDRVRDFVKARSQIITSFYVTREVLMDTDAFMAGDNLALSDFTRTR